MAEEPFKSTVKQPCSLPSVCLPGDLAASLTGLITLPLRKMSARKPKMTKRHSMLWAPSFVASFSIKCGMHSYFSGSMEDGMRRGFQGCPLSFPDEL